MHHYLPTQQIHTLHPIWLLHAVNILEIWDKDQYEAAIDAATLDFGALAEEVMGDQDDNDLS